MDIQNRGHLKIMVDAFYAKVQLDELLGPIFHQVIQNNWDAHLEKMYNFWDSILFHEPVYKGAPFPKHADLPIQPQHFNRWIDLFEQTVHEHFEGPMAEKAIAMGKNVAEVFMAKMFHPANPLTITK